MPEKYITIRKDDDESGKILHEHFLSEFRTSYILYGEKEYLLAGCYLDHADSFENFQVHEDDIWVVSFPKCGTTWTQEMVWMIANDLDFEGAKEPIMERCPNIMSSGQYDAARMAKIIPEFNKPWAVDSVGFTKELPRPRFIKYHGPWDLLPKQIRDGEVKPKIVYITRNPKDVCVSYFHHSLVFGKFTGTLDQFCHLFLDNKVLFSPFWDHVKSFWDRKDEPNIMFITYEQMKKDIRLVIRKTTSFLGKEELSEETVEKLVDHLSFKNMKNNGAVNLSHIFDELKSKGVIQQHGAHIRSGEVNSHKTEMSQEYIEKFNNWIQENSQKIGFSFD